MTTREADSVARARAASARIGLVGFGEVGQVLAADLSGLGAQDVVAWDRLFPSPDSRPSRAAARSPHVRAASGMAEALAGRTLVISAVTAGECLAAAREAAGGIAPGAHYLDLNSVSPTTRIAAAAAIDAAGGRFVEAAVMSPIGPKRSASPMLLGGPHAASFAALAPALGFLGVRPFAAEIGPASAAKMCRSVMIKGLEALLAESLLAARRYGVETTVLASLRDLFPSADWDALAAYMISRSLLHGRRRAEEMREVAKTVAEAGIDPAMSAACALRQDWAAAHGAVDTGAALPDLLDSVLRQIPAPGKDPA